MTSRLKAKLIKIAAEKISAQDPAHDFEHAHRVLLNALHIAARENGDVDIIVPAALFHDVITYPKNDPRSPNAQTESADVTKRILENIPEYPQAKIKQVCQAIELCSFSKGIIPTSLEAKILQDADALEATGAIAIMRTFSSTGLMNRPYYHQTDPFAEPRTIDSKAYALDLFFDRLLKVKDRMHTPAAKSMAEEQTSFLNRFLDQFKGELAGK